VWQTCMDAFVEQMEGAYSRGCPGSGRWRDSEQIRTLLAMADPDKAPLAASQRRHMRLDTEQENDFKKAKDLRLVLPGYAQAEHPPLWAEQERKRKEEAERRRAERERKEAERRRQADEAAAKAAYEGLSAEGKLLHDAERAVEAFLALDDAGRKTQTERDNLKSALNALTNGAPGWPDAAERERAADLLTAAYDNPAIGWHDGGDKKKREKREKKRRDAIAAIRRGKGT